MKIALLGAVAAATFGLAGAASASNSIVGLYNTGVADNNIVLSGHGADSHWSLAGGTAYTGADNSAFPVVGHWLTDSNLSRWLTPGPNAATSYDASSAGTYVYTTTFTLAGVTGARFNGQFAADNAAVIKLNGNILASEVGFGGFSSFSATSGFKVGVNTIEVDVTNYKQSSGNPTGLNVQFLDSTAGAAPEPAAWALMMVGVGGMGAALRTRRRKTVATA